MEQQNRHPIQIAAARTGLSPHVIRMWERRYTAVNPFRTPSNRRLYSDDDIARLRLLYRATQLGRSIGQIAGMGDDALRELVDADEQGATFDLSRFAPSPANHKNAGEFVESGIRAIASMNGPALEYELARAELALPQAQCVERVVAPLIQEVGDRWRTGALRIGHEHLASDILRTFLASMRQGLRASADAPRLIAATLTGQHHELGIQMAATLAAIDGWRVTYLGPNLPAEEIAAAADVLSARIVALSFVYPPDNAQLHRELKRLRQSMPQLTLILAGGRAAGAYADSLDEAGALRLSTLAEFRSELERLRAKI